MLLCVLLGAPLTLAALGLAEDILGVPIATRLIGQLGISLIFSGSLCLLLGRSLVWAIPLAIAITTYVNVSNFMDGVDGMSAAHGLVSGAFYCLVGLIADQPWVSIAGAVTAAAFAGFAPWNLLRSRVFLGDVGSYLLGALVVGCGTAVFLAGGSVLLATAPGLPYLADTGLTLARRAWRKESIFASHRNHVYQRLTDMGCSHLASSAAVATASGLCCSAALMDEFSNLAGSAAMTISLLVLLVYLTAPRWAKAVSDRVSA